MCACFGVVGIVSLPLPHTLDCSGGKGSWQIWRAPWAPWASRPSHRERPRLCRFCKCILESLVIFLDPVVKPFFFSLYQQQLALNVLPFPIKWLVRSGYPSLLVRTLPLCRDDSVEGHSFPVPNLSVLFLRDAARKADVRRHFVGE